ncbi:hypothetical protein MMC30_004886 [Trapelia coarctata]|nr:hypothetical protein [Trapelia coarctata]
MAPITRYILSTLSSWSPLPEPPTSGPVFAYNIARRDDSQPNDSQPNDPQRAADNTAIYWWFGYSVLAILFVVLVNIFVRCCCKPKRQGPNQGVQAYAYGDSYELVEVPAPAAQHGNDVEPQPILGLLTTERITAVQAPKLVAMREEQRRSDRRSVVGAEGDQELPPYAEVERNGS